MILLPYKSYCLSFSENFETKSSYSSSSLVWNISNQTLHPPLKVNDYHDGSSFKDLNLDIGDAKHGVFNTSTYSDWDNDGNLNDFIITISTDEYSSLEFESFNLASGWTLRPTGSNPLIIRVQGDITVNGQIDCSGDDGETVISSQSSVAQGGVGRCGGASGGDGGRDDGVTAVNPTAGANGGSSVTGGGAGIQQDITDGGDGGGGGGAYSQNLTDADNGVRPPASTGGAKGTNFEDNGFQEQGAGSGGGGGFYYSGTDTAQRSRGGGGGAGGGIVYIYAGGDITLNPSSKITANGGDGGGGALKAGGGGAGGGGSIIIFAGGEVNLNATQVLALGGQGGVTSGGDGGDGATGRTWITDGVGGDGPTGAGDNPISLLAAIGSINYQTGTFNSVSTVIDSFNSYPKFLSVDTAGTIQTGDQVLFDLSSNKSVSFTPNWSESSTLSNSKLERYFKYRIRMTSSDEDSPSSLEAVTFNFDAYVLTEFDMTTGCGSLNANMPFILLLFVFMPMFLLVFFKFKLKSNKGSRRKDIFTNQSV